MIPADELILRMVHKLNLKGYLQQTSTQSKQGQVQAMEALLRTLLYLTTHRSRDGVGYFDPAVAKNCPQSDQLFPTIAYGGAVIDESHTHCH